MIRKLSFKLCMPACRRHLYRRRLRRKSLTTWKRNRSCPRFQTEERQALPC